MIRCCCGYTFPLNLFFFVLALLCAYMTYEVSCIWNTNFPVIFTKKKNHRKTIDLLECFSLWKRTFILNYRQVVKIILFGFVLPMLILFSHHKFFLKKLFSSAALFTLGSNRKCLYKQCKRLHFFRATTNQ